MAKKIKPLTQRDIDLIRNVAKRFNHCPFEERCLIIKDFLKLNNPISEIAEVLKKE